MDVDVALMFDDAGEDVISRFRYSKPLTLPLAVFSVTEQSVIFTMVSEPVM